MILIFVTILIIYFLSIAIKEGNFSKALTLIKQYARTNFLKFLFKNLLYTENTGNEREKLRSKISLIYFYVSLILMFTLDALNNTIKVNVYFVIIIAGIIITLILGHLKSDKIN